MSGNTERIKDLDSTRDFHPNQWLEEELRYNTVLRHLEAPLRGSNRYYKRMVNMLAVFLFSLCSMNILAIAILFLNTAFTRWSLPIFGVLLLQALFSGIYFFVELSEHGLWFYEERIW